MNTFLGLLLGSLITVVSFALLDFTSEVTYKDVERATSVCKEGKWHSINNSEIICEDGAVYTRYLLNEHIIRGGKHQ